MAANPAKIVVEGVYKIFGRDAEAALDMTRSDEAKSAILEKTGCVVALNDIRASAPSARPWSRSRSSVSLASRTNIRASFPAACSSA